MEVKNYLLGYKDMYIMQDTELFNFSLDSVLLPNFVTLNPSINRIMDIGCGNAPIPLILSTRTKAKITGVEIQEKSYLLAKKSVSINNLENQIDIIHGDINVLYKDIESDTFDVITCNPPFFKTLDKKHLNEKEEKTLARHEITLNLKQIFQISRKLLKNNGVIAMVHRPERLLEIMDTMRENNIEPKRMQLIYPKKDKSANILLIEGRKNGKKGLEILPPIYTHKENGEYTETIKNFFEGRESYESEKL